MAGNAEQGTVLLGRPWREFARTVLLRCELGGHIAPVGWGDWGKPAFHEHGFFAEYACTGPGAQGDRAPYVRQLTDAQAEAYTYEAFIHSMD